jgi:hypothetical protein
LESVHPTYLLGNKASYCSDSVRIGPCKVYRCTRRNCARNNTLAASGLLILNYTPPGWRSPEQNKARLGPPRALLSSLYCSLSVRCVYLYLHTHQLSRWIMQFQVASMDLPPTYRDIACFGKIAFGQCVTHIHTTA